MAALTEALAWLLEGERPLVYIGSGTPDLAQVEAAARGFIEAHGLPAVVSWVSIDQMPTEHP